MKNIFFKRGYLLLLLGCSLSAFPVQRMKSETDIIRESLLSRLNGNWTHFETAEWTYGFYEQFAIFRSDFWEYVSVREKSDGGEILLKKGDDRIRLRIRFDIRNDSICRITCNGNRAHRFLRGRTEPPRLRKERNDFTDSGYRNDSVTLCGYFRNGEPGLSLSVRIPCCIRGENRQFVTKIDSTGRFRITFPVQNTTEIFVNCKNYRVSFCNVVEPGEHLFLFYDFATEQTRYMGENGRFHQEVSDYLRQYPPEADTLSYNEKMPHLRYLELRTERYEAEKKRLADYRATCPHLSRRTCSYLEKQPLFKFASLLMQRYFGLRWNQHELLPERFEAVADSLLPLLPVPHSLVSAANYYLNDYIGYYNYKSHTKITSIGPVDMIRQMEEKKLLILSSAQMDTLQIYQKAIDEAIKLMHQEADSVIVERQQEYCKQIAESLNSVFQKSVVLQYAQQVWPEESRQILAWKSIRYNIDVIDSIVLLPVVRELQIAALFYKQIDHARKPLSDFMTQQFDERVTNDAIREPVRSLQRHYEEIERQILVGEKSLKSNDALQPVGSAEELVEQLIGPYRGSVVYIDFWGTWCGPCKEEMQFVPDIKKHVQDKPVVFLYFANNSEETSWRNVIKEYGLTGPNVVHYNLPPKLQQLLESYYSVSKFPTFVLLDKQGRIVPNPFRPRDGQKLTDELLRLADQ